MMPFDGPVYPHSPMAPMTPRGGPLDERYWRECGVGLLILLVIGIFGTIAIALVISALSR